MLKSRTKAIVSLATGNGIQSGSGGKQTRGSKRLKKSDAPDYVGVFDRGEWDQLDAILKTNYKKKKKNLSNVSTEPRNNKTETLEYIPQGRFELSKDQDEKCVDITTNDQQRPTVDLKADDSQGTTVDIPPGGPTVDKTPDVQQVVTKDITPDDQQGTTIQTGIIADGLQEAYSEVTPQNPPQQCLNEKCVQITPARLQPVDQDAYVMEIVQEDAFSENLNDHCLDMSGIARSDEDAYLIEIALQDVPSQYQNGYFVDTTPLDSPLPEGLDEKPVDTPQDAPPEDHSGCFVEMTQIDVVPQSLGGNFEDAPSEGLDGKSVEITLEDASIDDKEGNDVEITPAVKKIDGKRKRDKVHCCKYCHKLIVSIGRHIQTVHKEELEVANFLALNAENRKLQLEQLEREGDYNYNKEVLATGSGELILVRRPTAAEIKTHTFDDYGPCTNCLGFMLKQHIWHHVKYGCKAKKATDTSYSARLGTEALLRAGTSKSFSEGYENYVISKFVKDAVGSLCTTDPTILKYGDFLFQKNLTVDSSQRAKNTRTSMRTLMGLFMKLKEKLPSLEPRYPTINKFEDIFDPSLFDIIVETVKDSCEFITIAKTDDLKSPSNAIRVGLELNKAGEYIRGLKLIADDKTGDQKIKNFIFLVKTQWNIRVSSTARSALDQRKYNSNELLPLTSDLLKLNKHVKDVCDEAKSQLQIGPNPNAYRSLCEAVLTRIILFNKRRSGESSKLKVKQYLDRGAWEKETTEELKKSLTQIERDLANNLTLVYTKGKRKNKVPVILTADMKENLDLLIKVRHLNGIDSKNPFIFARPYPSETPLRGHDCLKKLCNNAGLQSSERITGTRLRKYVATVCQIFNLTENEADWIAKHLGHDFRVHRQFYRLQESAVELAKVSRILLTIDKGKANQFSGKTLDEINIDDMSDLEEDGLHLSEEVDEQEEEISSDKEDRASFHSDDEDTNEEILPPKKPKAIKKNIKCIKVPWTTQEKTIVLKHFRNTIAKRKGVKKVDADECIAKNHILKNRTWLNIRDFVRNYIRKI